VRDSVIPARALPVTACRLRLRAGSELSRHSLGLSSRLAGFDKCRGRAPRGARPTSLGADASPGVRRAASWHALRCGVPHQRRLGALPPSLGARTESEAGAGGSQM